VNPWQELAGALAGVPRLETALCSGDTSGMWDDVNKPTPAINLCNHCPALQPCREWLATQPPNSVSGIIAGQVLPWASPWHGRRSKVASRVAEGEPAQAFSPPPWVRDSEVWPVLQKYFVPRSHG
jgi:hypothetical protein